MHARGVPISVPSLVKRGRRDLVNAAREYCGGIPRARLLARVPAPPRRRADRESWDASRVVEKILDRLELGQSVAYSRVPRKLALAARYYFGSWGAAIEAADLDYDAIRLLRTPYTREELVRELRALARRKPRMTLAALHEHRLAEPCIRQFGSLEAAGRAAGLERWPLRRTAPLLGRKATREALRARRRKGRPITVSDLEREDPHLLRSAIRHFGGLVEGAAASGLTVEPKRKSRWTDRELRAALRARLRAGAPMNPGAIRKDDRRLYAALKSRYGRLSRPEVARKLGLRSGTLTSVRTTWSRERVVSELQALARRGEPIVWKRVRPILKLMSVKYFGSISAARAAAGLSDPREAWTRKKVVERIRAHDRAERYPTALVAAAQRHFGTWLAARKAAGVPARARKRASR